MKNYLEIKDLSYSIQNELILNDISFNIKNQGDIVCVLGPSGIGKTTILRSIAGLRKINKGSPWIVGSTTRVMTLKAYTQHKGSRLVMSLRVS